MTDKKAGIDELEKGWSSIKKAIEKLENMLDQGWSRGQSRLFAPDEYVAVYDECFKLSGQNSPYNFSEELYERHRQTIEQYLTTTTVPMLRDKFKKGGHILLVDLQHRWENYQILSRWLEKIFRVLDRFHIKRNSLPTLEEVAMGCFQSTVYNEVKQDVTVSVVNLINQEREGEIIDKGIVKSIVELYVRMGKGGLETYKKDLEEDLLIKTREFYSLQQQKWINDSTPDYLIKTEEAINNERTRVADYLFSSTEVELLRIINEELLQKVQSTLIEKESSGCLALLRNDKVEDLQRMFRLFLPIENGLNPIAVIVRQYITSAGEDVISLRQARLDDGEKEKNDDPDFIKAIIELHEKYLAAIRRDFDGHALFQKALRDAFVTIVNKDVGRYTNAELMSTYCDRILKSGGEKLSDVEVEQQLEKIVQLFAYLTDKDIFAEIYRNQLAKRLLNQTATSDAEKVMIAKLKFHCGTQFTLKMEGMLSDIAVGGQHHHAFEQRMQQVSCKIGFSVQVLTTGYWPTYKNPPVTVSDEMQKCMNVFTEWHEQQHQKRTLRWVLTQGSTSVRGTYGKKSYDFHVSTIQAIVMDVFNGGVTLTLADLSQRLNLDYITLKPLLHSLACGKTQVIKKTPAGNKINNDDKFTANPRFTSNLRKIRIPMPSLEPSFSTKKVEADRSYVIDAVIVRVMKARKTLGHQQLISEILAQMSFFEPTVKVIKKRIEELIDREYLERSTEDVSVYNYLA